MGRIKLVLLTGLLLSASSRVALAGDEGAKVSGGGSTKSGSSWESPTNGSKETEKDADGPPKDERDAKWDHTDVYEAPEKGYWFIGARYRGTIVPQGMVNIFVNEGRTFYANAVGLEADYRKDGFSIVPAITYAEYGFDDTLFLEKNKPTTFAGNWSVVNSSLKGVYATVDVLWSTKISSNFDFEYGLGVGAGFLFGDLGINWLYTPASGPAKYTASDGQKFSPCATEGDGSGCRKTDHSGASVAKVGGYNEPNWADGGSKPLLFPHLSIPQIGLRFKPVKEFQARLGIGFALTGPWFGLSVDYGLEKKPKSSAKP